MYMVLCVGHLHKLIKSIKFVIWWDKMWNVWDVQTLHQTCKLFIFWQILSFTWGSCFIHTRLISTILLGDCERIDLCFPRSFS